METQPVRRDITKRSATNRSAVTNGSAAFVDGDGRGQWARRWRDLVELYLADLGAPETLSEAQHALCRRAATISVELENLDGRLSKGEFVDLDAYARVTGHLRRVLETLGIERKARDVTPSLSEYLAGRRPAAPLEAAE